MFVLDSHCDTPSQILRGRDLAKDNELAHIDIPKLKRGGVDAAFFALYIPADLEEEEAYEYACRLYRCVTEMIEANSDHVEEAGHTQRRDRASGVLPDILEHLPPKTRVCLLYCFVLSPLTLLGAVPHHHLTLSVKELTYSSN